MISNSILNRFKKHWKGPGAKLVVGKKEVRIGQGEIKTTVTFKNPSIVRSLMILPSLAFGEAYMRGDITIEGDMMQFLQGFVQSTTLVPRIIRQIRKALLYIPISIPKAVKNAQHHYDIGNDFYSLWLDPSKTYTCAYFLQESDSLAAAQYQKIDLVCKKIRLQAGMTMLDIGCGWGGALFHAAQRYDVVVTGVTPAKEQAAYIVEQAKKLRLEDRVRVIVADYRKLPELDKNTKYDRIISIGMFEQVGKAQLAEFFTIWKRMLKDDGISLLHTIGRTNEEDTGRDPWLEKYIFPGGYIPLLREIMRDAGKEQLKVVDVENLWQHYARTLNHWARNVEDKKEEVVNMFDEQFFRMWMLYLKSCEAGFRWGDLHLYQTVMLGKDATWPLNREVL
ncbi:MAG TPA: cyclopropane-fatty-acyl-phospholipid synthase family protein [Candidatus Andersenbacteria bacterium]|nr:cyclopropane-fatty-acyl-phospholipid synthase family protein [Candidatus Andersenbacteria bacterium]